MPGLGRGETQALRRTVHLPLIFARTAPQALRRSNDRKYCQRFQQIGLITPTLPPTFSALFSAQLIRHHFQGVPWNLAAKAFEFPALCKKFRRRKVLL